MLYPPRLFFKDKTILAASVLSAMVLILAWWYAVTRVHQTTDEVFLHYSIIFGIDQLGEWWKVWLIPATGTGLLVLNLLIAYVIYAQAKVLSRLICLMTVCLQVFLGIGLFLIVGLNL